MISRVAQTDSGSDRDATKDSAAFPAIESTEQFIGNSTSEDVIAPAFPAVISLSETLQLREKTDEPADLQDADNRETDRRAA